MGFPTKIQLIKRAKSEQWYINFPSAIAQAMEFERGEVVEWIIQDKERLLLQRKEANVNLEKKKLKENLLLMNYSRKESRHHLQSVAQG